MLRPLDLLPVYDSSSCDLIQDLIIPLLRRSKLYFRGVGFFTSSWLRLAAPGVADLVGNGGRAQIVLSPNIEESDWHALMLGEKAKHDDTLRQVLERNIRDLEQSLERDTLNALAWMVADEVLEFRFAVPRNLSSEGDYHDKVWVFIDDQGDRVALHGSFNDSKKATLNQEAISVFRSWVDAQIDFVELHHTRLQDLWDDRNTQFRVCTIPEAVRMQLVNLRSTQRRPYRLPSPTTLDTDLAIVEGPRRSTSLRNYQEDAVRSWVKAGCRGVFEMATGTGKTYAALSAAVDRHQVHGRLALLILVPYRHLLDQWARDCQLFGFNPILCSGDHADWPITVRSRISDFNLGASAHLCVLAVHNTASSSRFARAISRLNPDLTMIVGDEVHRLGAPELCNALTPLASMRLGLSATPHRWFDQRGTAIIFDYFGATCFEFPLDKAIKQRFLTPYEYHPELVTLSSAEEEDYTDLTAKIGRLSKAAETDREVAERLKKLLLRRTAILNGARSKVPRLLDILRDHMAECARKGEEPKHILVYCPPGGHREVLSSVSSLGLRCHEFVHTVSAPDRQLILDQFADGEIQVLVAIRCLDEGVDVPATRTAFLLASSTNPREFVQRRGRILRLAEGKERAVVYDFIVVPGASSSRDVGASLLRREMPRFAEFTSSASNQFGARAVIRDILDSHQMLGLLDRKPWDIYRDVAPAELVDLENEVANQDG